MKSLLAFGLTKSQPVVTHNMHAALEVEDELEDSSAFAFSTEPDHISDLVTPGESDDEDARLYALQQVAHKVQQGQKLSQR